MLLQFFLINLAYGAPPWCIFKSERYRLDNKIELCNSSKQILKTKYFKKLN